jgi:hypothetical protein
VSPNVSRLKRVIDIFCKNGEKKRLCYVAGAKITMYLKFLYPRAIVCDKLPNAQPQDVLTNCVVLAQEENSVKEAVDMYCNAP